MKGCGQAVRAAGVVLVAGMALPAAAQFDISRVGTLGGSESVALAINDLGQVVGQANLKGDAVAHAYVWEAGVLKDLGSLAEDASSKAWGINNRGEIVGESQVAGGFGAHAMYWGETTIDINDDMAAAGSLAWDINENGMVVGQGSLGPGFSKGFIWSRDAGGVAAGTLPGYMGGANLAINNRDESVGHSFFFGDPSVAHRVRRGDRGWESFEIGPTGYHQSIAMDINDAGLAVGLASTKEIPWGWQACIFTDERDAPLFLGTLDGFAESEANAINEAGMVVGLAYSQDPFASPHAWAWVAGRMYDLNNYIPVGSEFTLLLNALDVNERGDIVGTGLTEEGTLAGFVIHGFVPAPGTLAMLVLGGLVATRRRR